MRKTEFMLVRLVASALLFVAIAIPAQARDLTAEERTAVEARVAEYLAAPLPYLLAVSSGYS